MPILGHYCARMMHASGIADKCAKGVDIAGYGSVLQHAPAMCAVTRPQGVVIHEEQHQRVTADGSDAAPFFRGQHQIMLAFQIQVKRDSRSIHLNYIRGGAHIAHKQGRAVGDKVPITYPIGAIQPNETCAATGAHTNQALKLIV